MRGLLVAGEIGGGMFVRLLVRAIAEEEEAVVVVVDVEIIAGAFWNAAPRAKGCLPSGKRKWHQLSRMQTKGNLTTSLPCHEDSRRRKQGFPFFTQPDHSFEIIPRFSPRLDMSTRIPLGDIRFNQSIRLNDQNRLILFLCRRSKSVD